MKRFLFVFVGLWPAAAWTQDEDAPEPVAPMTAPVAEVAAPVTAPVAAPPADGPVIAVRRHLIGTGIEANEPLGAAETFSAATAPQLSCFMELVNPTRGELKIQVKWFRNDALAFTQPMRLLPGPTTRTWARLKLNAQRTGAWRCDVETEAGAPISTARFRVEQ